MSSTDNEDDPSFLALSARLRHRIDNAFDSIVSSGTQSRQSNVEVLAGGFIVEGPEPSAEYEAGGFVVEDHPFRNSSGVQSHIPLSEIPQALRLLDLFPDDDIMGVFKNAARGWGAQGVRNDGVSRKDWRAVCTALLEGEQFGGSDREDPTADEDVEMTDPDSDEYEAEELSGDTEERSSDEYEEPSRTGARAGKAQQVAPGIPTTSRSAGTLTEAQKTRCRQDFSRFFPHVPDNELDQQRIMIKDITRIADLLKENLKAEEILEMLEAFSTSPDKSMSLAGFEHMMAVAKLV